jgi:hypothetical protein
MVGTTVEASSALIRMGIVFKLRTSRKEKEERQLVPGKVV